MPDHYSKNKHKIKELWEKDEIQQWNIDNKTKLSLDWNSIYFQKDSGINLITLSPTQYSTAAYLSFENTTKQYGAGEIVIFNIPDNLIPFMNIVPVLQTEEEGQIDAIINQFNFDAFIYIRAEETSKIYIHYDISIQTSSSKPMGYTTIKLYITISNPYNYYEIRKKQK